MRVSVTSVRLFISNILSIYFSRTSTITTAEINDYREVTHVKEEMNEELSTNEQKDTGGS